MHTIASPGKSTTHQVSPGRSAASLMMLPQLAVGATYCDGVRVIPSTRELYAA